MRLPEITITYGPKEGLGEEQRKRATICPDRAFWRYLFAGLLAAGQSAGSDGDEILSSQVVGEADTLLSELEKEVPSA